MGVATGRYFGKIRSTGRGSDHFGGCDQCGKHMSETFVSGLAREYKHENGDLYFSNIDGGDYGHKECLIEWFGEEREVKKGEGHAF